jgi:hypothetical protein
MTTVAEYDERGLPACPKPGFVLIYWLVTLVEDRTVVRWG